VLIAQPMNACLTPSVPCGVRRLCGPLFAVVAFATVAIGSPGCGDDAPSAETAGDGAEPAGTGEATSPDATDGGDSTGGASATGETADTGETGGTDDTAGTGDTGETPLADLVDPFIGTGGTKRGNCFPGAVRPWGLVSPSPDTVPSQGPIEGGLRAAGYLYEDDLIQGFSHTRLQATSTPDLGVVRLMPGIGAEASLTTVAGYRSTYDKASETAEPGYYAVTLNKPGARAELTATPRAALHRYTFASVPDDGEVRIVADIAVAMLDTPTVDAEVVLEGNRLTGYARPTGRFSVEAIGGLKTYFAIEFDPPPTRIELFARGQLAKTLTRAAGPGVGAIASFAAPPGGVIHARVGISYVDGAGAEANLAADLPAGAAFDPLRIDARRAWESVLGRVRFEGGTDEQRRIMATALYHSFITPTVYTDHDGRYRGLDGAVHSADWPYHTNFSMWDTYRTVHPLLDLALPERAALMARSLVQMGLDGGYMPRWPMGHGYPDVTAGAPANIVVGSSILRGVERIDAVQALDLMLKEIDSPPPPGHPHAGREGLSTYLDAGYVPDGAARRVVTHTLENNVADGAIAAVAAQLGRPADAARARGWSKSYESLWDDTLRVFRPRKADGAFVTPFEELTGGGEWYYGGNALQWSWHVPHDMAGLVALHPSPAAFATRLEAFFTQSRDALEGGAPMDRYNHSDEPSFHVPYLFLAVGRPDLAQTWIDWVQTSFYTAAPDGLAGNDDAGAMSAWYVLTALGLYPVPASDLWLVGRPLFDRVTIAAGDRPLVIERGGNGPFVQAVTLNDAVLPRPWVRHSQLRAGGVLRFEMGPAPAAWGSEFGQP
jgi:predicted alpha-1,2-mannosidase